MRVYVERDRSRLRIRVVYQGKKHQFSTGLMDTKTNRAYVQGIASRIELDMVSGQFDPTLLKYRPNAVGSNPAGMSCPELFRRFTEHQFKAKGLAPGSRRRYQPIQSYLEQRLNVPAHQVSDRIAGNYAALLLERLTARSAKERLWMLASCWDWAQGRYHVAELNPWTAQVQKIKPQPSQKQGNRTRFATKARDYIVTMFKALRTSSR
jgi:integrase